MNTANAAAEQYKSDGVVSLFIPRMNIFTTTAIDVLDNTSRTTVYGIFHSTNM